MDGQNQISTLEVEKLMNYLAESIGDMEPEKVWEEDDSSLIVKEARAEGVRELFLNEVTLYKKALLTKALVEYEISKANIQKRKTALPHDPVERRQLLQSLLARSSNLEPFLTLQHRDFRELSDEDVESLLRQLDALGVLK